MASDLAPALLVALNTILDPNFRRSVVLMLEHDPEEGAIGLVVNRATSYPVEVLCENLGLPFRGDSEATVDWGGPVQEDQGWLLLDDDAVSSTGGEFVAEGLHWSRSQEALRVLAQDPLPRARIFLGYAGWGAGQLEREIAEGGWLVVPHDADLVFDEPLDGMWERAVRSLGIEPATLVPSQGMN